jgi:hypothetical protein
MDRVLGWGQKLGSIVKSWKRRYFAIIGEELLYFRSMKAAKPGNTPVGNLDLIRVTKIEERMTEKGLGVALTTTDRVWELVPTDSNQVGEWMSTFYERCRRAQKPDKPTVSASNYATRHY